MAMARGKSSRPQTNAAGSPTRSTKPTLARADRSDSAASPAPTTRTFTRSPRCTYRTPAGKVAIRLKERQDRGLDRAAARLVAQRGAAARQHLELRLPPEAAPAAKSLSAAEHRAACRTGHHGRRLEPELPPLLTPAVELQTLVVLGPAEQGLQLLVRRILGDAFLQDLDRLLLLAALVLAPGVHAVEERLALVPSHRGVEHLLHLRVLLAAEEDGGEHRLRQPELHQGRGALAQVRLRFVELLLHVEEHADVRVQAGGDPELPAREGERVLERLHRPLRLAGHHLLLGDLHHRLQLLAGAASEEDVGADRRDQAGKDGPERVRNAGQVEDEEPDGAGCE